MLELLILDFLISWNPFSFGETWIAKMVEVVGYCSWYSGDDMKYKLHPSVMS